MNLRTSLPFVSLALLLMACGGTVQTSTGATTTGAGTGGGLPSGSTSSSSTTASTSTSSSPSTSSSSGASPCGTGSITLVVDNGAPETLASDCSGTWNPTLVTIAEGYVLQGGPPPGIYALNIAGCTSSAPMSEGLSISLSNAMGPGTYTAGLVRYTDSGGSEWGYSDDPFSVVITQEGAVGTHIEGTFTANVSHVMNGNAAHTLSGSFSVCRVLDENAP